MAKLLIETQPLQSNINKHKEVLKKYGYSQASYDNWKGVTRFTNAKLNHVAYVRNDGSWSVHSGQLGHQGKGKSVSSLEKILTNLHT